MSAKGPNESIGKKPNDTEKDRGMAETAHSKDHDGSSDDLSTVISKLESAEDLKIPVSRRRFIGWAAAGTAAIGLAGCAKAGETDGKTTTTVAGSPQTTESEQTGSDSGSEKTPIERSREMDDFHEAVVKEFPQKTEGKGNMPLEPKLVDGVKVFEITCKRVKWEMKKDVTVDAMTYNGTVPGPLIRVTQGDKVRVVVKNLMLESTSIHWHGIPVPFEQDGVPYISQKQPIKQGETFTYEFTIPENNYGSHMYHSHHDAATQVTQGLLGAMIVDPKDKSKEPVVDHDVIMILNEGLGGIFSLNGKGFPATEPIVAKMGQKVRIRYMNEGLQIHPMHLHGLTMDVIAKDGYMLSAPYKCDTLNIAPGDRFDVIVDCDNKGVWPFHCHILTHAESEHGMHGMVTVLIVE